MACVPCRGAARIRDGRVVDIEVPLPFEVLGPHWPVPRALPWQKSQSTERWIQTHSESEIRSTQKRLRATATQAAARASMSVARKTVWWRVFFSSPLSAQ